MRLSSPSLSLSPPPSPRLFTVVVSLILPPRPPSLPPPPHPQHIASSSACKQWHGGQPQRQTLGHDPGGTDLSLFPTLLSLLTPLPSGGPPRPSVSHSSPPPYRASRQMPPLSITQRMHSCLFAKVCVFIYVSISLVLLSARQTTERKSFHSWSRDGDGGGEVERERMDMGWVESRQPQRATDE